MSRTDVTNQVQLLEMWSLHKTLSLLQWNQFTMNIRKATPASTILASSVFIQVIDVTQEFCICLFFSLEHLSLRMFCHTHPCIVSGSVLVIFYLSFKMPFFSIISSLSFYYTDTLSLFSAHIAPYRTLILSYSRYHVAEQSRE